jgi:hypothetical protein
MKSASVILLFVVSLLGGGLALQAKDSFSPSPKFGFGVATLQQLAADGGGASVGNEADVLAAPPLPRLQPHSLEVVGR